MSAINSGVTVIFQGQSHAILNFTGGGETVDAPLPHHGGVHLTNRLNAWMPGVTVTLAMASNGGNPPTYTLVSGNALIREFQEPSGAGWWRLDQAAFDTHGGATRDFILNRGNAARLCVLVHYCNTQDTNGTAWNANTYAAGLRAYYEAIHAACAPSFARFLILPVINGSRTTGADNLGWARRCVDALAGIDPGAAGLPAPLPYVLPPVYATRWTEIASWNSASSDFTHVARSAGWTAAANIASRIAGANGFVPPLLGQPNLSHAQRLSPTTARAFLVSPNGLPIKRQVAAPQTGWGIIGGGSVVDASPINNTMVATTRFATVDLTLTGQPDGGRLTFFAGSRNAPFQNGPTPPRGELRNVYFADGTPGATLTITDAAEDLFSPHIVAIAGQNEAGVPIL